MYQFLTKLFPKNLNKKYSELIRFSTLKVDPRRFVGFIILLGILLSLTVSVYMLFWIKGWFILSFIGMFVFIELVVFFLLYLSADRKAKFVDTILPDALQIMASNLRAGITTDKALLLTARPEFGPLKIELDRVGHEVTLGKEITAALQSMANNINSAKLQRTILMITTGIRSGGSLAPLLEQTAEDIRKQEILDNKIKASIGMYTIFIFIAVGLASPGLFALSYILVQVITKILGNIEIPSGAMTSVPISIGEVHLPLGFLSWFILLFIFSNCFFGSLILGAVSKGRSKRGLVFLPVLVAFAYTIFFAARILLTNLFGDLFGL